MLHLPPEIVVLDVSDISKAAILHEMKHPFEIIGILPSLEESTLKPTVNCVNKICFHELLKKKGYLKLQHALFLESSLICNQIYPSGHSS